LPAQRLSALAFVTAELVTNALKYGKGTVSVRLATDGNVLRLAVEDEGDGGDRSVPFSRIVVRFRASQGA